MDLSHVLVGLSVALAPSNLVYCFIGVFLGMVVGVLPGIGALAAMSMLFPLTIVMDPTSALIMLAGIYYGTSYGGSTAAILLNIPGSPSSAVSCLDGYPMSKQGRGGVALLMTTVGSFVGGSFGILLMIFAAPFLANVALDFGPWEYFALMTMGMVAAATISTGSALKSLSMILLGILFGIIGRDQSSGDARFTFNLLELTDGIDIGIFAIGLFGISEVIASIRPSADADVKTQKVTFRSMLPTRDDIGRSIAPILRGSGIGCFAGVLPGLGGMIASFMSYAAEIKFSKNPERFGKGAIEGVLGPEAANNAADQASFIPTMTLGLPTGANMALILAMLMVHGINPGPEILVQKPDMFWGLVMSFWVGNLMLVILNVPLIGIWVRLLTLPYHLLFPGIIVITCIGTYATDFSAFDIWLVIVFGAIGYGLKQINFPIAPLVLGFVLGPLMEVHFRRAMVISRGDILSFFERPISGTVMVVTLAIICWSLWAGWRNRQEEAMA